VNILLEDAIKNHACSVTTLVVDNPNPDIVGVAFGLLGHDYVELDDDGSLHICCRIKNGFASIKCDASIGLLNCGKRAQMGSPSIVVS